MDLIKIEKRVPGTLILKFQDLKNYANKIDIAIEHNQEFRMIPLELVLGMFQIPSTLTAFKNGMWTMSNADKEKVFKLAVEQGLYYSGEDVSSEQPKVLYSETQIREAVKFSRLNVLDDIIKQGSKGQKLFLIDVARSEYENLKQKTIEIIEKGLGIALAESVE